jgi:hypothetical protein
VDAQSQELDLLRNRARELDRSHEQERQRFEALEAEVAGHARVRHQLGARRA